MFRNGTILGLLLASSCVATGDVTDVGQGIQSINGIKPIGVGVTVTAPDIPFTPTTPSNWSPAPTTTGGALDTLAAGSGISIGTSVTSGTANSVLYLGASHVLAQDNANFFWDYTNHRLGLLTTAPATTIDVVHKFEVNSSGNVVKLNNVTTSFPAAQGGASTVLQNDGAGNLTWVTASAPAIGGALTGVTTGSVIYGSGGNFAQDNSNFFWDGTNHRLGIGTTSPAQPLDVHGNINFGAQSTLSDFVGSGQANLFIGVTAGNATLTTASDNVGLGRQVLNHLTTGAINFAAVDGALQNLTTGQANVAIGYVAGQSITSGQNNFALGTNSLVSMTSGQNNVAIGAYAAENLLGSSNNIALGYGALLFEDNGSYNMAIGYEALARQTGVSGNVGIGYFAGQFITSGTGNTVIATNGAQTLTSGSNATIIGNGADVSGATTTYETVIGSGATGGGSHTVTLGRTGDGINIPDTGAHGGNTPHSCTTVSSNAGTATVACAANSIATGGGADCGNVALFVTYSKPTGGPPATGWSASCVTNTNIVVYALCCLY